jgi:hypothetical protein
VTSTNAPAGLRPRNFALALLTLVAATLWAWDFVTLDGERTVYTVQCHDGEWHQLSCSGRLAAAERYRFRTLPSEGQVEYWIAGARDRAGRFTGCEIRSGRNWRCPGSADAARTITTEMRHGRAVHDDSGRLPSFYAVTKWRWYLLQWGVPLGRAADF